VLVCRIDGNQRELPIGSFPAWSTEPARQEAARLKREIEVGRNAPPPPLRAGLPARSSAGKRSNHMALTDRTVRELPFAADGKRLTWDTVLKGFALRATAQTKTFVLVDRIDGKQRELPIGSFPAWSTDQARQEAARLKREIDLGRDPHRERQQARLAPTVKEFARVYLTEVALPRKSPKSIYEDRLMIRRFIDPMVTIRGPVENAAEPYTDPDRREDREIAELFGNAKLREVDHNDIDDLNYKVTMSGRKVTANRLLALISKMMTVAERKGLRDRGSNPCRGAERNREYKRESYLRDSQLAKLLGVLDEYPLRDATDVVMLALLTGSRSGEIMKMRWSEIDLESGIWHKPAPKTKPREPQHLPLGVPAIRLLEDRRNEDAGSPWVFPGRRRGQPLTSIKKAWREICLQAGIQPGREDGFVLHDMRHQFASLAVSGGASLPMVGGLLGHASPTTTARYAHLFDGPLREVTEAVGRRLVPSSTDSARRPA
jgi:integrase